MKKYHLLCLALILGLSPMAQDKKELKQIAKEYNVYEQGKIWSKADQVIILGANLRFKIAAKQTEATSWKQEANVKFSDYAVLEGIDDALLQEISDEYGTMLETRFKALGLEVVPYEKIKGTKRYASLVEKEEMKRETVKKEWGVAQVYSAGQHPYVSYNNADPFGPQYNIPKELKAIMVNSMITVDFAHIGIDIKQSGSSYHGSVNSRIVYTEGSSSVVPSIHIDGHTYNDRGLFMLEDNSYIFAIKEQNKVFNAFGNGIESNVEFATSAERCDSCEPEFAKRSGFSLKQMESGLGTVVIKADPDLYKKAVIDALNQYLDKVFALYTAQRNN